MLRMLLNKKNSVYFPYKVELVGNQVILEASGFYKEAYLVFHVVITPNKIDSKVIYIRLNELMTKNIEININSRDVNRFKVNFDNILNKEEINDITISDKRVLREVTI